MRKVKLASIREFNCLSFLFGFHKLTTFHMIIQVNILFGNIRLIKFLRAKIWSIKLLCLHLGRLILQIHDLNCRCRLSLTSTKISLNHALLIKFRQLVFVWFQKTSFCKHVRKFDLVLRRKNSSSILLFLSLHGSLNCQSKTIDYPLNEFLQLKIFYWLLYDLVWDNLKLPKLSFLFDFNLINKHEPLNQ